MQGERGTITTAEAVAQGHRAQEKHRTREKIYRV